MPLMNPSTNLHEVVAAEDVLRGELSGDVKTGCAVVQCYVCQTFLVLVRLAPLGVVSLNDAIIVAQERGWALEPSDLWACPNCKDVPLPEHGETE